MNLCLSQLEDEFNSEKGRKKSFSCETKALIHLSQWEEWISGAQSLIKSRLLCESMFILIGRHTLIPKKVERKAFLWNQSINIIYPNKENVVMVPNLEKKGVYYVNPCLSQLTDEHRF